MDSALTPISPDPHLPSAWTRLTTPVGRLTLCRTAVFYAAMARFYTTLHRHTPQNTRAEILSVEEEMDLSTASYRSYFGAPVGDQSYACRRSCDWRARSGPEFGWSGRRDSNPA